MVSLESFSGSLLYLLSRYHREEETTKRAKPILTAVLAFAIIVIAFHAYSVNSITRPAPAFAPSPSGSPSYPNPVNRNVTLTGPVASTVVSPTCALSNHPCAMSGGSLYYITVNGVNYRLIFPASMKLPTNGLHIMVTGTYVTPSTYQSSQWTPKLSFGGDIYVISYSYIFPYV